MADADTPRGEPELPADHRSGFVAICGRPNVGKSTLLNALLGEPVAVASDHPQTTRERLLGIWTEPTFQVVLVDTPGIHRAKSALNEFMVNQAVAAARDVDLVLLLAETPRLADAAQAEVWDPGPVALQALHALRDLGHPVVLVLTKIDQLTPPDLLLPVIERWRREHEFAAIVSTAALQGQGLQQLRDEIVSRLPVGPRYFDPEDLSDRNLRWHAAELIRGQLFEHLRQELPYSCAVMIDRYKQRTEHDDIEATLYVERDSQKGMVIGKGARTIKAISQAARADISRLTGRPCNLRVRVEVAKNWTRDPAKLEQLGYRDRSGRPGPSTKGRGS